MDEDEDDNDNADFYACVYMFYNNFRPEPFRLDVLLMSMYSRFPLGTLVPPLQTHAHWVLNCLKVPVSK